MAKAITKNQHNLLRCSLVNSQKLVRALYLELLRLILRISILI